MNLAHLPTPLEPLPRLGAHLGLDDLWVKRDDLTGLALGGNKARKLELLLADALARGADTLVTGGGPQSNHARITAAAAAAAGLDCHLALAGPVPAHTDGNLLLDHLLGATLHFEGAVEYEEIEQAIATVADRLAAAGRRPYAIPVGGASVVGVAAYALAIDELEEQLLALGRPAFDWIVVADGSGGTQAGLLAGLGTSTTRVVGVDVGTRPDLDTAVPELASRAAEHLGRDATLGPTIIDHDHVGRGYGWATDGAIAAMRNAARTEGLILDPVYSAKAMDALVTRVRDGRLGGRVLFWHTGGAPALFAREYERPLTR
ncbi:MAG: D-cysteine desulfhydrase family protein [Actinomycetes bacterium]